MGQLQLPDGSLPSYTVLYNSFMVTTRPLELYASQVRLYPTTDTKPYWFPDSVWKKAACMVTHTG